MNIFESFLPKKEVPKLDENGEVVWEPQPDFKGSFGMPKEPSREGYEVRELKDGMTEEQQRKVIEGVIHERTPVIEDVLAIKTIDSVTEEENNQGVGWDDPRARLAGDLRAQRREDDNRKAA